MNTAKELTMGSNLSYAVTETKPSRPGEPAEYGIAAFYGDGSVAASVDGISCDKNELLGLAKSFNRLGLSSIHIRDAVEDFLVAKSQL